jgi:hypothetical protein
LESGGPPALDLRAERYALMAVYRRTPGGPYHVEVEWRGYPRLRLSTGTRRKARADTMERTLKDLHTPPGATFSASWLPIASSSPMCTRSISSARPTSSTGSPTSRVPPWGSWWTSGSAGSPVPARSVRAPAGPSPHVRSSDTPRAGLASSRCCPAAAPAGSRTSPRASSPSIAPSGGPLAPHRRRSTATSARSPPSSRGANQSAGSRSPGRPSLRRVSPAAGSGGSRPMRSRHSRARCRRPGGRSMRCWCTPGCAGARRRGSPGATCGWRSGGSR